jgi:hypothetical protein
MAARMAFSRFLAFFLGIEFSECEFFDFGRISGTGKSGTGSGSA